MGRWIMSATIVLTSLLCTNQVQAGTASYLAKCSFLDRGNNNGGNVSRMPCYAVEGGNAYGAFFHIAWKDGVKTRMNAKLNDPLTDAATSRTFKTVERYTFVANDDGDVITLDDVKYINGRYGVDDPDVMKLLK
jgi:hypothetical protein